MHYLELDKFVEVKKVEVKAYKTTQLPEALARCINAISRNTDEEQKLEAEKNVLLAEIAMRY